MLVGKINHPQIEMIVQMFHSWHSTVLQQNSKTSIRDVLTLCASQCLYMRTEISQSTLKTREDSFHLNLMRQ